MGREGEGVGPKSERMAERSLLKMWGFLVRTMKTQLSKVAVVSRPARRMPGVRLELY